MGRTEEKKIIRDGKIQTDKRTIDLVCSPDVSSLRIIRSFFTLKSS